MRRSWEEGVGVVWDNTGDMLNCRRFSALKGAVFCSRCTMGGEEQPIRVPFYASNDVRTMNSSASSRMF